MTDSKIASVFSSGIPPRNVAKDLGVSLATLRGGIPASEQEVNLA
jgi:hypothetical protein